MRISLQGGQPSPTPAPGRGDDWKGARARIGRLRAVQAASLLVLGALTVAMTLWFAHQVSMADRSREQAEQVRSALIDARDRIRVGHTTYWRHRALGEPLISPSTIARLELARFRFAELAALSRTGGEPAATAASAAAAEALERLRAVVDRMRESRPETARELAAADASGRRALAQLDAATDDWLAAESRRATAAAARQSLLSGRLSMAVAAATGAMVLVALLTSLAIERARRRTLDELVGAAEDLEGMSVTDPLTGLANRRAFDNAMLLELSRADRSGGPVSVVILDIDNFKAINDRLGHAGGDDVLAEVARRLQRLGRAQDVVARIGGEEFAWILPGADAREALRAAERARRAVADSAILGQPVTISAGAAELEGDGIEIIRRADAALYTAKKLGRDQAVLS